jgi:hypothetical protein
MSKKLKLGTRVKTEHGTGTIIDHEQVSERLPRYGIKLDNNVFGWKVNCYYFFTDEVETL